MSRKAGTPNKPKSIDVSSFNKELLQNEIEQTRQKDINKITEDYEYVICESNNKNDLAIMVRESMRNLNYICQGGVSVTNYRGLDGKIVMVYCQAMIRKE